LFHFPGQLLLNSLVSRCGGGGRKTRLFQEKPSQLVAAVVDAKTIGRIYDPDQGIGLFKIIPPV
jgi:hypothetical protein